MDKNLQAWIFFTLEMDVNHVHPAECVNYEFAIISLEFESLYS